MGYRSYLTYEEYQNLGGSLPENAFNTMERKAHRMIDHITYDRVKYLYIIPEEVKEAVATLIDQMSRSSVFGSKSIGVAPNDNIVQYSNNVETITYRNGAGTSKEAFTNLKTSVLPILPDWLVYRGLDVTVDEFIKMVPARYLYPDQDLMINKVWHGECDAGADL